MWCCALGPSFGVAVESRRCANRLLLYRKRRVKCDKTKPACQRCINFRGSCIGYEASVPSSSRSQQHPRCSVRQPVAIAPVPVVLSSEPAARWPASVPGSSSQGPDSSNLASTDSGMKDSPAPAPRQFASRGSSNTLDSSAKLDEDWTIDEDWTTITDMAKRRRIQNRIAQRNYRM